MPYAQGTVFWVGSSRPRIPDPFDDTLARKDFAIASAAAEKPYALFGPVGVGKSSLMALTASNVHAPEGGAISYRTRHAWLDKRVLWTQASEFYRDILAEIDLRRKYADFDDNYSATGLASVVPCLFIDDLGTEADTHAAVETFGAIIDARYRRELATWFTTNLSIDDFIARYGNRTTSRLLHACDFVNVSGIDRRTQLAA